jgi:hypothetical protein
LLRQAWCQVEPDWFPGPFCCVCNEMSFWPSEATCSEGKEAVADWLPSSIQQVPKRKSVRSGQPLKYRRSRLKSSQLLHQSPSMRESGRATCSNPGPSSGVLPTSTNVSLNSPHASVIVAGFVIGDDYEIFEIRKRTKAGNSTRLHARVAVAMPVLRTTLLSR